MKTKNNGKVDEPLEIFMKHLHDRASNLKFEKNP